MKLVPNIKSNPKVFHKQIKRRESANERPKKWDICPEADGTAEVVKKARVELLKVDQTLLDMTVESVDEGNVVYVVVMNLEHKGIRNRS
eukprot:g29740.t1